MSTLYNYRSGTASWAKKNSYELSFMMCLNPDGSECVASFLIGSAHKLRSFNGREGWGYG